MPLGKTRLIIPIVFCLSFFSLIKAETDKFYGSNNNLSNSHVNSIYQDNEGYIWVCTENGLNVFDGIDFKTYYHISSDTTSLINNSVLSVLEDSQNRFWIGTIGGVQILDRETERFGTIRFSYPNITDFSYFRCIIEDSKGNIWMSTSRAGAICIKKNSTQPIYYMQTNSNICSNKINIIYEDRFGNIWIGSQDNGISVLNLDNHTIVNHAHDSNNIKTISSNRVFSITESADGKILVGTIDGGIDAFDFNTHTFERNYIPAGETVFTTMRDCKNNIWIGTDGNGLKKYNPVNKSIATYESEISNLDLRKAKVHSIIEDKQGNIWVSLYQKGILMIPQKDKIFNNIGFNAFYPLKNIGTECILSITEDSNSDIWIGTDGNGIYRLNKNKEVVQHYDISKLQSNIILTIFEDSKGNIWAGSYLHGLFLYNKPKDRFEQRTLKHNGTSINHINIITEDNDGNLWIGTNEKGVCIYKPETHESDFLLYDLMKTEDQLLSNSIHTITFDKNGNVWIGTNCGLSHYDIKNKAFESYTLDNGRLTNNNIFATIADKDGGLWVGTNYGLNYINPATDETLYFTEKNGLSNAVISGIEIDKNNNLWISTYFGLSHYDCKTKEFSNYYSHNGLINNEFRRGAHFKTKSGELFFGSINGLSYFYPFKEQREHPVSNLVFTDLYIHNKRVNVKDSANSVLRVNINSTPTVNLEYNQSSFSITFTALEYNNPDRVVYQVMLDGFDNEWLTLPPRTNSATYTNIASGNYVLRVKAFLPGTESIERGLSIVIAPPLWLTWWAKMLYIIILAAIIYTIYCNIKKSTRKRKEDIRKKNENEIMQSKLQFFTDISHEIRTPLTLILTPVEQLLKDTPTGKLSDIYKLIYQNGQRILRLVNQVMDMRKIDRGHVKLQVAETNVTEFITKIAASFHNIAQEKKILFQLNIADNLPLVWIDEEKLDKIIFNILSNAFKYTPAEGSITVSATSTETDLYIRISDTGIGIPEDMRGLIFDRFYQIPNHENSNTMGTGIGLHLSRQLIEIHHGQLYVEDSGGHGTTFAITIPLDSSYFDSSEILVEKPPAIVTGADEAELALPINNTSITNRGRNKKHKILLVEDDKDIRNYIADVLIDNYNIITAENGKTGLEMAIQEQPDCIITDVMMPEMDGIQMCDKIKNNDKTNHIPIIILTAKTNIEHRVEGLKVGADSYIPKPFNIEHLKTRILMLIELRQKMKNRYEGKNEITQGDLNLKTADEKFIERLEAIVKNKIAEPDLSVESLSQEIGLSRSQLQRKLKQLTNQNPSDYIKTTRLRHAAWLLASKRMTISEITYATGFSSLSHFSNSFKEFYGMSPSRYMEINNTNTDDWT